PGCSLLRFAENSVDQLPVRAEAPAVLFQFWLFAILIAIREFQRQQFAKQLRLLRGGDFAKIPFQARSPACFPRSLKAVANAVLPCQPSGCGVLAIGRIVAHGASPLSAAPRHSA